VIIDNDGGRARVTERLSAAAGCTAVGVLRRWLCRGVNVFFFLDH